MLLWPCAVGAAWWIDSYRTDFTVNKDGTLTVNERITANFTEEPHHGIYRDIPLQYSDGLGRNIRYRVNVLFIDDGEGKNYPYQTSWSGGTVRLKVGDPNRTWQDVRPYRIVYELKRWCLNFPDRQELYWNAIGNGWAVPIRQAMATVQLPEGVDAPNARTTAFTGAAGSKGGDYSAGFEEGLWKFQVTRPLDPYEGLTVAVTWPGKPVPTPGLWQEALWTIQDNLILLIPILAFAFMFWKWWTTGRDPRGRETIAVMYHPPEGLSAAEAGTLIDERVDLRDITASLVELAKSRYLTIREEGEKGLLFKKPDFTLVKTDGMAWDHLPSHQQFLLEKLFEGRDETKLSDLDTTFYQHLPGIRSRIYKSLVDQGYFARSPDTIRGIYIAIGILLLIFGIVGVFVGAKLFGGEPSLINILSVVLTSIILLVFGAAMPAKTGKGVMAKEHILGLEEYVQRAEKETLKMEERQDVFEEILPYAMALGISSKWAQVFAGMFTQPPSWYQHHGAYTGWNAYSFERNLNHACSTLGSSMTSTPRSSGGGGGFGGGGGSGGGGGGGGGGAW